MTWQQHARAALCATAIGLSLTFFSLPLVVLASAKLVAPRARILTAAMNGIYRQAVEFDDWCLMRIARVRWNLPALQLDAGQTCLVLCNHRSWCDVLVVQSLIAKKGPVITFLTKRELAFVPVFGIIVWAFRFPLLKRRARGSQSEAARRESDRQRILTACAAVRQAPAAILTFAEGTRFSPEKHRLTHSPHRHLLPPRPGGFNAIYDSLADTGALVVDLTLDYDGEVTFWRFLAGAASVSATATVWDWDELAECDRSAWLRQRWQIKDRQLAREAAEPA